MRGNNSGNRDTNNAKDHAPAFSVHDEIRRNRRIERNKRIRQARATRRKVFTFVLCFAVLLITLTAVLFAVTRVQTVVVSGNERYSVDEIAAAADVYGDILPLMGGESVYKKIVSECPYVNSIELKKTYPATVEIVVAEAEVVYCANIHDRQYSLDKDLRVIEFTKKSDGLALLKLPEAVTVVEGQRIVFSEEKYNELVPKLLGEMFSPDSPLRLTSLDITDRFSISGTVGDSIKISFGDYDDVALKLSAASQLVKKAEEQHSARTLINVSTLSGVGPSMILDYEGDF